MIRTIKWMAVILSSVFCAFLVNAQTSLTERLKHIYEFQDMDMGLRLYKEINEGDIRQLSDSSLFIYHYLGAYINSELLPDNEKNPEKALSHFLEAKRLCETSIGVHSGDYMEVMRGLGDTYIELGQCEEAANIYQEGIVKSMYMRDVVPHDFGNLIIGLQECYEQLGWFGEIPSHLQDAWIFWKKDFEPFETYNYYPLWALEQFYRRYGMYDQALQISDEIINFISEQAGAEHPEIAEELYFRGHILSDCGKGEDAIKTYKKALRIFEILELESNETYRAILGNLLITLASLDRNEECGNVLRKIKEYGNKLGDNDIYNNALYVLSKEFQSKGLYDNALILNTELLSKELSKNARELAEDQKRQLLYSKKVVNDIFENERLFKDSKIGSNGWFEIAFNLASAYFRKNESRKYLDILNMMYQEIPNNSTAKEKYYLAILGGLCNSYLDNEDSDQALKYATEKFEYESSIQDFPERYKFNTYNNIIVSKLKSKHLNDIDKDLEKIGVFYQKDYGEFSSEYATFLHNRGRAFQLQGKLEEAKSTLLKSITIQNKVEGKPLDRTVKYYIEVEQQLGEL